MQTSEKEQETQADCTRIALAGRSNDVGSIPGGIGLVMVLPDGREITVLGLLPEEVRQIGPFADIRLTIDAARRWVAL